MYLADGHIRLAWEVALLAGFHRGRLELTQTASPAVRAFVETAGSPALSMVSESKDVADISPFSISAAARGRGYVNQLYALLGALTPDEHGNPSDLPSLFRTRTWDATRRGGPDQDLKIGFNPDEDDADPEDAGLVPNHICWDSEGWLPDGG